MNFPHIDDFNTSYFIYFASRLIYLESSKKFKGAYC